MSRAKHRRREKLRRIEKQRQIAADERAKRACAAVEAATEVDYDIKLDIVRTVQSIIFPVAGACLYRAAIGLLTLHRLSLPASPRFGSMLYRAGSDPMRDVVAFCGAGNVACFVEGSYLGHVWLQLGDDLIDFSTVDWSHLTTENACLPSMAEEDAKIGQIVWEKMPPDLLWQPAKPFYDAWRSTSDEDRYAAPEVGNAWYGPLAAAAQDEALRRFLNVLRECKAYDGIIDNNIRAFRLKERLGEHPALLLAA